MWRQWYKMQYVLPLLTPEALEGRTVDLKIVVLLCTTDRRLELVGHEE
jgi:hypothetical protein